MNLEKFIEEVMLSIMRATVNAQKMAENIGDGCEINPVYHSDMNNGLKARVKKVNAELLRVDEAEFDVAVAVSNDGSARANLKVLEFVKIGGVMDYTNQNISRVKFVIPYKLPTQRNSLNASHGND